MVTSIVESVLRFIILAGVLAVIIITGWNEPLKYRFMSREELTAIRNPPPPPPEPETPDTKWMWDKNRGSLDRGAYGRTNNRSSLFGR